MSHITLTPAYGRDYANRSEVREAYFRGQDFILHQTFAQELPINREQIRSDFGGFDVNIRFRKLASIVVIGPREDHPRDLDAIRKALTKALTVYDLKLAAKSLKSGGRIYHNPCAMCQYLEAIDRVLEFMTGPRQCNASEALRNSFSEPLLGIAIKTLY